MLATPGVSSLQNFDDFGKNLQKFEFCPNFSPTLQNHLGWRKSFFFGRQLRQIWIGFSEGLSNGDGLDQIFELFFAENSKFKKIDFQKFCKEDTPGVASMLDTPPS